jgi:cytochrome P450 PksS
VDLPDIASPAFKRDPFPILAGMRASCPVARLPAGGDKAPWLVTRHADVVALLKDGRFSKDMEKVPGARLPWTPAFARPLTRNMLDLDEPDHRRLRALVQQAFTPQRIEPMHARILALSTALLDQAGRSGRIDLVRDYAAPIPTIIIAEMLGIPAAHRARFQRWTSRIVAADASQWAIVRAVPAIWRFMRYLRRLIAAKRREPADDLLGALILARDGDDRMSEDELLAMAFLLIVAGHETTVNLISGGIFDLIGHPDVAERLLAEPALIGPAVEELLRFSAPVMNATVRFARHDLDLAGTPIPAGALVYASLASANRDEAVWERPDELDIARSPNRHLGFGDGPHFCAGAALARAEAQIAILEFLRRFPRARLSGVPEWKAGIILRGLRTLPLDLRGG